MKRLLPASRLLLMTVSCVTVTLLSGVVGNDSRALAAEDAKPLPSAADLEFFESKIRPLLIEACVDCHSVDDPQSDLQLDTLAGMLAGGTSGPAFVSGAPEDSLLMAVIEYKDEALRMPPDGKLPEPQIELIREWIRRGAPHPESGNTETLQRRAGLWDMDEARQFWAFRPIATPIPPTAPADTDADWIQQPPDAFVMAGLQANGLVPAPPADKLALIRRATFGLTGLPPTPDDIRDFLADDSPRAFEKVVDRLLDSSAYGEHWGRHWLDIARYADSNGMDENVAHGNAWRYRDYVIRSMNQDKPLDQFIVEQIAGDLLLPSPLPETLTADQADHLIATGFLTLGAKVLAEADQAKMRMDIIDEQIDTMGRALMGLTLGCARCHDHKFDPISTADYYALAGIMGSTHTMESLKTVAKWNENTIAAAEDRQRQADHAQQVAQLETQIAERVATATAEAAARAEAAANAVSETTTPETAAPAAETPAETPADPEAAFTESQRGELATLRKQLDELKKAAPAMPTAMGVRDADAIEDVRIHVRGSHLTLGKSVPRGIPQLLVDEQGFPIAESTSGRLEMAQWMVSRQNPLSARVLANRLWRWHFGRGLVETTDNFGILGSEPSHPELLDWLANELIDNGWSLKAMHRRVMLSSTYQMSTQFSEANYERDPANRYYWRNDVRRLQAESIRDAILAVSGQLNRTMGGSMLNVANYGFIFDHTSTDRTSYDTTRRSVYLPVIRNNLHDPFALFDYTSADVPMGDRESSTVAPQALYLMNSDFVLQAAQTLAQQLANEVPEDDAARLQLLYQRVLGRAPQPAESQRTLAFIQRFQSLDAAATHASSEAVDSTDTKDASVAEAAADADSAAADDPVADPAWVAACQSLLACSEFLYVP